MGPWPQDDRGRGAAGGAAVLHQDRLGALRPCQGEGPVQGYRGLVVSVHPAPTMLACYQHSCMAVLYACASRPSCVVSKGAVDTQIRMLEGLILSFNYCIQPALICSNLRAQNLHAQACVPNQPKPVPCQRRPSPASPARACCRARCTRSPPSRTSSTPSTTSRSETPQMGLGAVGHQTHSTQVWRRGMGWACRRCLPYGRTDT